MPYLETVGDDAHPAYAADQFGSGMNSDDLCAVFEEDLGMYDDPVPGTVEFEDAKDKAGVMDTTSVTALLRAKMHGIRTGDKQLESNASAELLEGVHDVTELISMYVNCEGKDPRKQEIILHRVFQEGCETLFYVGVQAARVVRPILARLNLRQA